LLNKCCLLIRCQHEISIAFFGCGQSGEDSSTNAKVWLPHMRTLFDTIEAQSDTSKILYRHRWDTPAYRARCYITAQSEAVLSFFRPAGRLLRHLALILCGIEPTLRRCDQPVLSDPPSLKTTDVNLATGTSWSSVGAGQRPIVFGTAHLNS